MFALCVSIFRRGGHMADGVGGDDNSHGFEGRLVALRRTCLDAGKSTVCRLEDKGVYALNPGPQLSQERRVHQAGAGRSPGPCLTP